MFRQYDLVIFDFDYTIAKLAVDWSGLKRRLAETYKPADFTHLDAGIDALSQEKRSEAYNIIRKYELDGIEGMEPIYETVGIIKNLKGKKMALFTTNTRAAIERGLDRLGLSGMFALTVCKEDVEHHKPNPEGLNMILQKTNIPKNKAIYIGDKQKDMDAGKAAGIKSILVSEINKGDTA
jgi:HAD superfamily hydrolase (TIGR01549 family)